MTASPPSNSVKPTSVSAWKKGSAPETLELPSGNYMRVKRLGMQTLVRAGIMPNSLMNLAEKAVARGKKQAAITDRDLVSILKDQKRVQDIAKFMDDVLVMCAYEPPVHHLPEDGVEKRDDLLYVDEVDEEDKMFIFQLVTGGTADLESFRREAHATMDALRGREDVELPSE